MKIGKSKLHKPKSIAIKEDVRCGLYSEN